MKTPILSIGFTATESDPARLRVQRHDDDLLNDCDWPLTLLAARGYDGACLLVGNAVLRLLERAHPALFAAHPGIAPPPPVVTHTEALVLELIVRSERYATHRYVGAIDDLIQRIEPEPGCTSLPAQWPGIRNRLLSYPE